VSVDPPAPASQPMGGRRTFREGAPVIPPRRRWASAHGVDATNSVIRHVRVCMVSAAARVVSAARECAMAPNGIANACQRLGGCARSCSRRQRVADRHCRGRVRREQAHTPPLPCRQASRPMLTSPTFTPMPRSLAWLSWSTVVHSVSRDCKRTNRLQSACCARPGTIAGSGRHGSGSRAEGSGQTPATAL